VGSSDLCFDAADAKSKGGQIAWIIEDRVAFLDVCADTLRQDIGDRRSTVTYPPPWLGELTAHQWACVGAVHQAIHRRHMERIVAGLREKAAD